MRRLPGETTDSKTGLLINSFILVLFLISNLSFSQVPINGFCYRNDYPISKGYSAVISADLNSNGNTELIFYSPGIKQIGIYSGIKNDTAVYKELLIKSEISQLKPVKNTAGFNNLFSAVDRKQRKVSFFSIYIDSLSEKIGEISFDSYPENILTGDIDLNGNDEVLVFGSAFDGLSILYKAEDGIGERKIAPGTTFSEAAFLDINDDGFPDIAAFDILENSLRFFVNNTRGIFRDLRTISYPNKIGSLRSFDLNLDGIPDILYTINNRIEIVFGDYRSEFKNKISLKIEGEPASVQIGDFNSDKIPDIAYLILNNSLNIIFGKDGQEFFEQVPYLKNASIISFTRSRFASAFELACLTNSGELTLLSSRNLNSTDIKISLGISAGAIKKFDYDNDGNDDIAFVDENDRSLKLLVNNNSGIPSKYYSIPLAEPHSEIKVDEFFRFRKIFYCYSKNAPLLEVFRYNFKTDRINRKQLYAPGEILDVYFQRIDSSFVNIFVLYNKKSKMYLGKFENRDVSITFKEYPVIDRNVAEAKLFVMDEPVIYYWKSENNTFEFKTVRIKTGPNEEKTNLSVLNSVGTKINLYGADQFDNEYPFVASLVQSEMENYLVVVSADKISISKKINESIGNEKPEFGKAFFGETSIKGINNFTVNSINDNYIYKLVYRQTDNTYLLNQMFPAENVSDYLFARLNKKNYFLVYSNKEENCVSIRSLKK